MIALALALFAQAPIAPTPPPAPADASSTPPIDWRRECALLVDKGALDVAADCYRHAGRAGVDADAALALALADVVGNARLTVPVRASVPAATDPGGRFDLGAFALGGGPEAVAFAAVDGFIAGAAASTVAARATPLPPAIVFVPLLTGAGAGAAVLTGLVALDVSAGDVHLVRLGALLGPAEALALSLLVSSSPSTSDVAVLGATLAGVAVPLAVASAAAVAVDVDPGAPSLATSFALSGALVGCAVAQATDIGSTSSAAAVQAVVVGASVGGHVGLAAGFVAAPHLQLSRPATLLIDAGTLAGLAAGSALAFGLRAPNPAIGYGTIGAGVVVGTGLGVVGAVAADAAFRDE